jgi:hypothetical protein
VEQILRRLTLTVMWKQRRSVFFKVTSPTANTYKPVCKILVNVSILVSLVSGCVLSMHFVNTGGCKLSILLLKKSNSKKGKGFPLQAWNGCWVSRRLRLLDRLDIRHYEGGKVVTLTHRPSLPPGVLLVLVFRGWVDSRAHGSVGSFGKNPQRHHWGSIPRPSD